MQNVQTVNFIAEFEYIVLPTSKAICVSKVNFAKVSYSMPINSFSLLHKNCIHL